jgi:DNA mismatch repair protein MutS
MIFDDYAGYTAEYKAEYGELTLVLIEVGSFWEIYDCDKRTGADTKSISDILNIQVSKKNKSIKEVSRTNPLMAGFPSHALDRFLPMLLENNYTVVLVSQTTPPPNPKREVTHILSKGTVVGEGYAYAPNHGHSTNNLATIYAEQHTSTITRKTVYNVGASIVDLSTGKTWVFESASASASVDPMYPFDELYKIMSFYRPCEVVLFGDAIDIDVLQYVQPFGTGTGAVKIIDMRGTYDKQVHKLAFQDHILNKVYENDSMLSIIETLDLERYTLASLAHVQLLSYCLKHNERVTLRISRPELIERNKHLDLSFNAAEQLDLDGLCKVLNKCTTAIGRRYFRQRLFNPFYLVSDMEASWDAIEHWHMRTDDVSEVRKKLAMTYDLERLGRRIAVGTLSFSNELPFVQKTLETLETLETLNASAPKQVLDFINEYIDFDTKEGIPGFKRGVYPAIDELSDRLGCLKEQVRVNFVGALNTTLKTEYCKIESNDRDGYYLVLTAKRYKDVEARLKEFTYEFEKGTSACMADCKISKSTQTGQVKITHAAFETIRGREELTEKRLASLVQEKYGDFLTELTLRFRATLDLLVETIAKLDFATTCAYNAQEFRYARPKAANNDNSSLDIVGLRHPIIERILTSIAYVENDLTIKGMLLYGLNAAGKSSMMKAIGLNAIMAQCGMYVACKEMRFAPFDSIFCRINKSDNMYNGQSTFMVEMSELRNIMKRATSRSLVLGDELCSGTEFVSALAIVTAGLKKLVDVGASFLFATHLHELCDISLIKEMNIPTFHLDVYCDRGTGDLVYNRKLQPGQGSTSYGIEVCKALDMDESFLELAAEVREEYMGGKAANASKASNASIKVKKSRYNASVFVDRCQVCGGKASEVHHVKEQQSADEHGFIGTVHKNHKSNLVAICESCHDKVHGKAESTTIKGYIMTSKGRKLVVVDG